MEVDDYNLARLAETHLERFGDRKSLFFEGTWYSSGDLHDRSVRLGAGLRELGIEPGDRVVVMMANCPEVGIVYQALWRAGAVITPAIFLLSVDALRHILLDSGARAVITTPEFLQTVQHAAAGIDPVRWIISSERAGDVVNLDDLLAADPEGITPRRNDDLAALMYTGGTTGRAKGVMLSHENLWFCGKASREASHVEGITKSLVPLPLSHSYGLIVTVVGLHAIEPGESVLMRWFDADGWCRLIQEHRIQITTVVPTMLQLLLATPLESFDLSTLRYVVSGAAPLSKDVIDEFEKRIPGVEIREGYGLTESSAGMTLNPAGAVKSGSVGVANSGFEIKIVDDEANELPPNEIGEIACRSRAIMAGYWRDEDATRTAVRNGWLYTGDLGYLDDDGYLFIVDRKKDLIIRGGFNVYPRDVEDALVEHPDVAVAGVVGRPDAVAGEEVVAFVQLVQGAQATSGELIEFAKARLGKYKYPREIHIVEQVPLTHVFKIDRKALRARLTAAGSDVQA